MKKIISVLIFSALNSHANPLYCFNNNLSILVEDSIVVSRETPYGIRNKTFTIQSRQQLENHLSIAAQSGEESIVFNLNSQGTGSLEFVKSLHGAYTVPLVCTAP